MSSWLLGSSASSFNPSLAWVMGNGGKGHKPILFPLSLETGWYREQKCTRFQTLEHRKEKNGLMHEFIVLKLLNGSVCRIERMGDPNARFDAIRSRGAVAHDMVECFEKSEMEKAHLKTSDVISEITFPCEFDIKDVLIICRAIHEGGKTRNYTLQVFNCYFFALAIQVCLARFVAHWEDKVLVTKWLSQANTGIELLVDGLHQSVAIATGRSVGVPLAQQPPLLRIFQALVQRDQFTDPGYVLSFIEGIKLKIQSRLGTTETSQSSHDQILHIINSLLWYSTIESGLERFIEESIKEALQDVISEGIASFSSSAPESDNTPVQQQLNVRLLLGLAQLLVSAGRKPRNTPKPLLGKSKHLRQIPVHRVEPAFPDRSELDFNGSQVSTALPNSAKLSSAYKSGAKNYLLNWGFWLITIILSTLGRIGTVFAKVLPLCLWVKIDRDLEQIALELEELEQIGRHDLTRLLQKVNTLAATKDAYWDKDPWKDIHSCIKGHMSTDLIKYIETNKPKIKCSLKEQSEMKTVDISVFQNHVLERIGMQARMVASARLGSESKIRQELQDMLAHVWTMIRQDPSINENAIHARHADTSTIEASEIIEGLRRLFDAVDRQTDIGYASAVPSPQNAEYSSESPIPFDNHDWDIRNSTTAIASSWHTTDSRERRLLIIGSEYNSVHFRRATTETNTNLATLVSLDGVSHDIQSLTSVFKKRLFQVETLVGDSFDAETILKRVKLFLGDATKGDVRAIIFTGRAARTQVDQKVAIIPPARCHDESDPDEGLISADAWRAAVNDSTQSGVIVLSIFATSMSGDLMSQSVNMKDLNDAVSINATPFDPRTSAPAPIFITFASSGSDQDSYESLVGPSSGETLFRYHDHFLRAFALAALETRLLDWQGFIQTLEEKFSQLRMIDAICAAQDPDVRDSNWLETHPQTPVYSCSLSQLPPLEDVMPWAIPLVKSEPPTPEIAKPINLTEDFLAHIALCNKTLEITPSDVILPVVV